MTSLGSKSSQLHHRILVEPSYLQVTVGQSYMIEHMTAFVCVYACIHKSHIHSNFHSSQLLGRILLENIEEEGLHSIHLYVALEPFLALT